MLSPAAYGTHLRADFGFPSANYAGAFIALLACAIVGLLAGVKPRSFFGILAYGILAGLLVALLTTYSRGAAVGLFAGCIYIVTLALVRGAIGNNRQTWIPLVVCAAYIAALFWTSSIERSLPTYVAKDESVSARRLLWSASACIICKGPFIGLGFGNSGFAYSNLYQALSDTRRYETAVSTFFTIGVEFGPVGLLLYVMGFVYIPASNLLRCRLGNLQSSGLMWPGSVLVLFTCNLFSTLGLGIIFQVIYAVLAIHVLWSLVNDLRKGYFSPLLVSIATAAGALFVAILVYYISAKHSFNYLVSWPNRKEIRLSANNSTAESPGHAEVTFYSDPSLSSHYPVRDLRAFLQRNSWISGCTVIDSLADPSTQTPTRLVFVMGEWTKHIEKISAAPNAELVVVYPRTLVPGDTWLQICRSRHLRIIAVITQFPMTIDEQGEWEREMSGSIPKFFVGDYRSLAMCPDET